MRSQLCNNHFTVEWGGTRIGFTEVSGLSMELDVVPHRQAGMLDELRAERARAQR